MTEQAFDHVGTVLDLSTHTWFGVLHFLFAAAQFFVLELTAQSRPHGRVPFDVGADVFCQFAHALVAGVKKEEGDRCRSGHAGRLIASETTPERIEARWTKKHSSPIVLETPAPSLGGQHTPKKFEAGFAVLRPDRPDGQCLRDVEGKAHLRIVGQQFGEQDLGILVLENIAVATHA